MGVPRRSRSRRPPPELRPGWRDLHLAVLTAATAWSTALGWQAQLVSHPLFRAVREEDFSAYHRQYDRTIPVVVIVPGIASFLAGCAFWWTRPVDVPRPVAAVVAAAGAVSLGSTALWAVPMHDRLDRVGRSEATIDSLLRANLLRSAALTVSTATLVGTVWRRSATRSPAGAGRPPTSVGRTRSPAAV
ncbi:hypothetical protein [Modestobacter versicolor]|uniref:hypothetical protein n=1 Tax=Modestobacter versicolor TaxID=429133 RepID=UPI0034DEC358